MRKRSEVGRAPLYPDGFPGEKSADTAEKTPSGNPSPVTYQAPGIPADALAGYAALGPGDQLSITIGREKYSPTKYNTFEIGPFSATVTVRPHETGDQAAMRCYRTLLELSEAEFNIAWGRHLERLKKIDRKS